MFFLKSEKTKNTYSRTLGTASSSPSRQGVFQHLVAGGVDCRAQGGGETWAGLEFNDATYMYFTKAL